MDFILAVDRPAQAYFCSLRAFVGFLAFQRRCLFVLTVYIIFKALLLAFYKAVENRGAGDEERLYGPSTFRDQLSKMGMKLPIRMSRQLTYPCCPIIQNCTVCALN